MKPEVAKVVETELKRFATDLNLTDAQKTQMKTVLENAGERLDAIREKNPDVTKEDVRAKLREVRSSLRERVEKFFHAGTTYEMGCGSRQSQKLSGLHLNVLTTVRLVSGLISKLT